MMLQNIYFFDSFYNALNIYGTISAILFSIYKLANFKFEITLWTHI